MLKINYSYELNTYIEKLDFEKKRYFDILKYLSLQEDTKTEIIEEYYQKTFNAYLAFELLKEEIVNITCPKELKNSQINYTIHFNEGSIEDEL